MKFTLSSNKRMPSKYLAIFFFYVFGMSALSAHALETVDQARYLTFTHEVRCIVCQNQSLADSNAPIANDLRAKIHTLISEKKSDAEIKDYLVKRYGEFILLRPRFNALTALLWLFPALCVLGVVLFFGTRAYRKK